MLSDLGPSIKREHVPAQLKADPDLEEFMDEFISPGVSFLRVKNGLMVYRIIEPTGRARQGIAKQKKAS
jgi:hypothetical protein